jgi:hypothetical protein
LRRNIFERATHEHVGECVPKLSIEFLLAILFLNPTFEDVMTMRKLLLVFTLATLLTPLFLLDAKPTRADAGGPFPVQTKKPKPDPEPAPKPGPREGGADD